MCEFLTGNTCKIDLGYCAVPKDHACGKRVHYKANRSPQQPECVPVVLNDLLNAISKNEEVVLLAGTTAQLDGNEPRYRIEITGPERLLKPLADVLCDGV